MCHEGEALNGATALRKDIANEELSCHVAYFRPRQHLIGLRQGLSTDFKVLLGME
jgi:hypothetical protein